MNYTSFNPANMDALMNALVNQESRWNPKALSPAGAMGLTQVMPATARQPGYGVAPLSDPWDPAANYKFGQDYLTAMLEEFNGQIEPALVAYNAGPGNASKFVASGGDYSVLPRASETQPYVSKIMANYLDDPDYALPDVGSGQFNVGGKDVGGAGGEPTGRIQGTLNGIFGAADNPMMAAEQLENRAERAQSRADKSREIFNTNAPTSWLNVLGTAAQDVGALSIENKAAQKKSEGRQQIQDLMASGELDAETLAQISILDPELGEQLRQESRQDRIREEDRNWQTQQADVQWQRQLELLEKEAALEGLEPTQIEKDLLAAGYEKGTEEYIEAYRRKMFGSEGDGRTAIMKNVEAMGYEPGSPEYQKKLAELLDAENSPEAKAATIAAEAAAANADKFAETLGKEAGVEAAGLGTSAKTAAAQIPQWKIARDAMDDFRSGALSPTQKGVGAFLSSLGITEQDMKDFGVYDIMRSWNLTPGQAASMEQVERVVNEAIIGKIGSGGSEGGFPANNFSNADLEFLKTSVPGLTNTEGGMRAKLTMLEWRDKATIAKADAWVQYQTELQEQGRAPTSVDWERFNMEWRNSPVNEQFVREMEMSVAADETIHNPAQVFSQEDYDALPVGSYYVAPDGSKRRKKAPVEANQ